MATAYFEVGAQSGPVDHPTMIKLRKRAEREGVPVLERGEFPDGAKG